MTLGFEISSVVGSSFATGFAMWLLCSLDVLFVVCVVYVLGRGGGDSVYSQVVNAIVCVGTGT